MTILCVVILAVASCAGVDILLKALLAAAARKKTSFRAAALAALQRILQALSKPSESGLQQGTPPSAGVPCDGAAVWQVVSRPLVEALQQHMTASSTPPVPASSSSSAAAVAGGEGESGSEVKPLPLAEVCK